MAVTQNMTHDFDLESLVNLEQTFYDIGYQEGFAHGQVLGQNEGQALGEQKGFELWNEIGFYLGFASMWKSILDKEGNPDERVHQHIAQLLRIVAQFPIENPPADSDVDVPQLLGQARSRYKALCARLGVRPTLRLSDVEEDYG